MDTCPCQGIRYLFMEYHWPHCLLNPQRSGAKDNLSNEVRAVTTVSQPALQNRRHVKL